MVIIIESEMEKKRDFMTSTAANKKNTLDLLPIATLNDQSKKLLEQLNTEFDKQTDPKEKLSFVGGVYWRINNTPTQNPLANNTYISEIITNIQRLDKEQQNSIVKVIETKHQELKLAVNKEKARQTALLKPAEEKPLPHFVAPAAPVEPDPNATFVGKKRPDKSQVGGVEGRARITPGGTLIPSTQNNRTLLEKVNFNPPETREEAIMGHELVAAGTIDMTSHSSNNSKQGSNQSKIKLSALKEARKIGSNLKKLLLKFKSVKTLNQPKDKGPKI